MKPQVSKREAKPNWRLKKTLSRKLESRPIEDDDIKYVWVAYQKGALASMGEKFAVPNMGAAEFKAEFEKEIFSNYDGGWVLTCDTSKGYRPAGIVLGFWSHRNVDKSPFMIVGDMIWFPWATKRNRIECAVHFFSKIRNEIPMVEYARGEQTKRFFEMLARHGIMRRVGTTFNVYPGEAVAVFETRRPD